MKLLFKPTILIATSILALSSYTTSAAQSTQSPEIIKTAALTQPVATHPILRSSAKKTPQVTPQKIVSARADDIQTTQRIDTEHTIDYIAYSSLEERQARRQNVEKYSYEFRGLRPSALINNNGKIGSTSQYSRFDDNLYFDRQSTSNSRFKNDAENLFIRLQLNF